MAILSGLRIVELTQGLTGPYTAQMAADMGAEVVKVEPPTGDHARTWGPPFLNGESLAYLSLNRNKRSVVVDLEQPAGREALRAILKTADVLIEELSPSEAKRLGLSYDDNALLNPRLIQLHLDHFGDLGPRADQPGAELPVQAMLDYPGGFGAIGEPPVRIGCDLGSMNTSVFGFQAILAALLYREDTGRGQRVAVSVAGALAFLKTFIIAAPSDPDEWWGFHLDSWVKPRQHGYRTQTTPVWIGMRFRPGPEGDAAYLKLIKDLGMDEVLDDPRFANNGRESAGSGRYAHQVAGIWERALARFTASEAVEFLRERGAEAFEITNYQTITEHPQFAALGIQREVPHPNGGTFKALGNAWQAGPGMEREQHSAPPLLGADTDAVLAEAGLAAGAVVSLRASGAVK